MDGFQWIILLFHKKKQLLKLIFSVKVDKFGGHKIWLVARATKKTKSAIKWDWTVQIKWDTIQLSRMEVFKARQYSHNQIYGSHKPPLLLPLDTSWFLLCPSSWSSPKAVLSHQWSSCMTETTIKQRQNSIRTCLWFNRKCRSFFF